MKFSEIIGDTPFTLIKWQNSAGWPLEFVSDNVQALLGYAPDELLSHKVNYFDLISSEDIAKIDVQLSAIENHSRNQFKLDVYRVSTGVGKIIWVEHYVTVIRDDTGLVTAYIGYIFDVTLRVETERNLIVSRNEMRALVNALPDTIIQISKRGDLKNYILGKATETGEARREVYLSEVFPPEFARHVPEYLSTAIQEKAIGIYEFQRTLADGNLRYYEARFSEMNDDDAIVAVRDISDYKESEQMLRSVMQEAEKANREKTKFLSNMSHELRTPLNAILGFSQVLLEEQGEGKVYVQEILDAGKYLLSLINDSLDLSRIEAGRIDLSINEVSVRRVIEDTRKFVREPAERSQIQLRWPENDVDLWVKADARRLTQVLINLCSNAIKYNRPRGSVAIRCEYANANRIAITVADTGAGMTEAQIARLFRPFERLGSEFTQIEGTGLGLTLSKNLLELMGGRIDVRSVSGSGSEFTITLDAVVKAHGEAERQVQSSISTGADPRHETLQHIVYIEDNLQSQKLLKIALPVNKGYDIDLVATGYEGISKVLNTQPDVVLLDINLPDISGYEVLRQIKCNAKTRSIPVIAVTAEFRGDTGALADLSDFHSYLAKPVSIDELKAILRDIAEARRGENYY